MDWELAPRPCPCPPTPTSCPILGHPLIPAEMMLRPQHLMLLPTCLPDPAPVLRPCHLEPLHLPDTHLNAPAAPKPCRLWGSAQDS